MSTVGSRIGSLGALGFNLFGPSLLTRCRVYWGHELF